MSITVTVYGDYQCPYCARLNESLMRLLPGFGSKIKLVWKHFPLSFHKRAAPAAVAAETVRAVGGEKSFWEFHNLLFENQNSMTDANFEKWAKASGVDPLKFRAKYTSGEQTAVVRRDMASGKALGITSTPTTFVGNTKVAGDDPNAIRSAIEAQMPKASTPASTPASTTKTNELKEPAMAAISVGSEANLPGDDLPASIPLPGDKSVPDSISTGSDTPGEGLGNWNIDPAIFAQPFSEENCEAMRAIGAAHANEPLGATPEQIKQTMVAFLKLQGRQFDEAVVSKYVDCMVEGHASGGSSGSSSGLWIGIGIAAVAVGIFALTLRSK